MLHVLIESGFRISCFEFKTLVPDCPDGSNDNHSDRNAKKVQVPSSQSTGRKGHAKNGIKGPDHARGPGAQRIESGAYAGT
ncbi:MAG TPA: hypothetical protein VFX82_03405, partial [Desulfobacterales bacterium]|nr:hypothetical protein [Desulfobacterales bacterium]